MSKLSETIEIFLSQPPRQHDPHHDDTGVLAHPHMAMQCARKIYYQMNMPADGKINMPIVSGKLLHAYISLGIANEYENVQANVLIDLRPEFPLIGEADLVDDDEVIDLKTTSGNGYYYRKQEDSASLYHIIQTGIYAYALGRPKIGVFYLDRDKFRSIYFQYETEAYMELIHNELIRLAQLTQVTVRPGRYLPDGRKLDPFSDWECSYCQFRGPCLKGEEINWLPPGTTLQRITPAIAIAGTKNARILEREYPPLPEVKQWDK